MELKDVILATLEEMEDTQSIEQSNKESIIVEKVTPKADSSTFMKNKIDTIESFIQKTELLEEVKKIDTTHKITETEIIYLNSIKERLLVLFEGFQSPDNLHLETKLDITLNFLEYILSTIELRINSLEKEEK